MDLTSWVSKQINPEQKQIIESSSVWHYTRKEFINDIIVGSLDELSKGDVVSVRLSPPSGWSLNLWKLIRDVTVWDTSMSSVDYARYMYFFIGKPPDRIKAMNVQNAPYGIKVKGSDLLAACSGRIFMRKLDKVLVVRGDYNGQAIVHK